MSGNRQRFYCRKMLGSDSYGIHPPVKGVDKFCKSWGRGEGAGMQWEVREKIMCKEKISCAKNAIIIINI